MKDLPPGTGLKSAKCTDDVPRPGKRLLFYRVAYSLCHFLTLIVYHQRSSKAAVMDFWQGFTIVTCVHLLAAASPGPDFALVTRQSILYGRRAGILTSLGISLGLSIHILYSTAGLAAVVAHSTLGISLMKLAGGTYLVYLGIKGLRARPRQEVEVSSGHKQGVFSPYRQIVSGFLCNALNPKAPIYFLSLFTVVLSADMPLLTLAVYGGWIMLLQMFWFTSLALFFTKAAIRCRLFTIGHWIDRAFGAAMLALGLKVLNSYF
jgi:threonine/homoserine/homoserine lactone efflux protein